MRDTAQPTVVPEERPHAQVPDPIWDRLEDQIDWYDRKSGHAQRSYKRLKVVELMVAASLPVLAGLQCAPFGWLLSVLSTAIVVLEGVQHLFQYQEHWITYRSTCEALRHERYLYLALAGPYAGCDNPRVLLAERIEGQISREHTKWAASHTKPAMKADGGRREPDEWAPVSTLPEPS